MADVPYPNTVDEYQLGDFIGKGAFAKVHYAKTTDGRDVAVKIMDLDDIVSSLEDIVQEIRVMKLCQHPNVLSAYACFIVKSSLWLVMPVMKKGSCLRIMQYLKNAGYGDGMREEWIATILKDALEGLAYFHAQKHVHRDIKAGNLLMDSDGSVRISDFGVAGWLMSSDDRSTNRRTFVGTPCWMAPEVMEQTDVYNEKADIWSVGITALELAKGYAPYAKLQPMKVLLMTIKEPPPNLKTYEDAATTKVKFSRHFKEIITACLQKNPKMRPGAATLLTKTFFKKAKPDSSLVKDLLEAVPIPDTFNDVAVAADYTNQPGAAPIFETSESKKSNSFVRGSTWVFDDDEEEQEVLKIPGTIKEDTGFADFEKEFAAADIFGEHGAAEPPKEPAAAAASASTETAPAATSE